MKFKIPEDFEGKKGELEPIIMEAERLNEKLKKVCVLRGHKSRKNKKVYSIEKNWLQLEFVLYTRDLVKGKPLPAVIKIDPLPLGLLAKLEEAKTEDERGKIIAEFLNKKFPVDN